MAVVTIAINGKNFQLSCNDDEEERLTSASSILGEKVDNLKNLNPRASTELLLVMCAVGLQDEVVTLKSRLARVGDDTEDEKVAATLSTIADYLESLAKKING